MAYAFTAHNYGPLPWQRLILGSAGGSNQPCIVYVAGGGWGLRDTEVITDPTHPAAEPWVAGSLMNASSAYYQTYRIVGLQIASNSHNAFKQRGLSGWANSTAYANGDLAIATAGNFQCIRSHTSTKATALAGDWASGLTYAIGSFAVRPSDGRTYESLQAHTSAAGNEPGTGGGAAYWTDRSGADDVNWTNNWRKIPTNESLRQRISGRGDGTPAYGAQGIIDIQRAIAFLRANYERFGINPNKIVLAGGSAGGQACAAAAWGQFLPSGINNHPSSARPNVGHHLSYPNALLLNVTPAKLDQYITSNYTPYNGFLLSTLRSLWGREDISSFAGWDALPDRVKQSLDGFRTAERTGWVCPTFLDYRLTNHADRSTNSVFNGEAGVGPEAHHALNGWIYFEMLSKSIASGGWGMNGKTIFLEKHDSSNLRRYTSFNAGGGTVGNEYTLIGNGAQAVGDNEIAFFNSVMP